MTNLRNNPDWAIISTIIFGLLGGLIGYLLVGCCFIPITELVLAAPLEGIDSMTPNCFNLLSGVFGTLSGIGIGIAMPRLTGFRNGREKRESAANSSDTAEKES